VRTARPAPAAVPPPAPGTVRAGRRDPDDGDRLQPAATEAVPPRRSGRRRRRTSRRPRYPPAVRTGPPRRNRSAPVARYRPVGRRPVGGTERAPAWWRHPRPGGTLTLRRARRTRNRTPAAHGPGRRAPDGRFRGRDCGTDCRHHPGLLLPPHLLTVCCQAVKSRPIGGRARAAPYPVSAPGGVAAGCAAVENLRVTFPTSTRPPGADARYRADARSPAFARRPPPRKGCHE
jgi:hypothetical protein